MVIVPCRIIRRNKVHSGRKIFPACFGILTWLVEKANSVSKFGGRENGKIFAIGMLIGESKF